MKYIDMIKAGLDKMDKSRRPAQKDMAEAMGLKKAAITQRLKNRPDSTNKTAREVFQLLALAGWRAIIFDENGEIVMGTAHVDSPDGMEQKFIKRCEELARENEVLKAEISALKAKTLPTTESTDEMVDERVDEKRVSRKRNPKPQLFTIADLKHALIENGGTLKGQNADIAFAMALNYSDIATRRVETLQPSIPLVSRLVKAASEAGIINVTSEGSQGPKTLTVL
ncbi:XRE family transcriptional regulator [Escherichia coli]|uniref:XRE family transcriptional regulator n=1 Tax=Escherichia coli TaxID=562 RepID=UPI00273D2247|nr:XRE family transcriptional regulator [Escherichia coli]